MLGYLLMLRTASKVLIVTAIASYLTLSPIAHGQVELERFFPPVVSANATSTVKADGKFPVWPLSIVCDRADVLVTCGVKAGEFQVVVADDAAPGVAWLRLYDEKATTSLVPLLIERAPITVSVEPNDSISKATALMGPSVVAGKLEKNGDVDMWRLQVRSGHKLVAALTGNRLLNSPMDAVLQLVDMRGNILAQADDDRGLDPQLIYEAPADAELVLRLFAFPETPNSTIGFAGGANFNYVLSITSDGFVDHVLPLDDVSVDLVERVAYGWNLPTDAPLRNFIATSISPTLLYDSEAIGWQWSQPIATEGVKFKMDSQLHSTEDPIAPPLQLYGHIAEPEEVDRVRVKVQAGKSYRAQVRSRQNGFSLDSVLRVLKADGTELARNDDKERSQYDASVDFKSDQDGELVVELSDLANAGGFRNAYALGIDELKPEVEVTVDADHLFVAIGKSIEIPVQIQRRDGYSQKLEFSAVDLPVGFTLEKIVSEPKGDSSKSVKLKLTAAGDSAPFQGPIQLLATPLDKDNQSQATVPVTYSLRNQFKLSKIWLSASVAK